MMPKTCISIYDKFSNIGPMHKTWPWGIKVKYNEFFNNDIILNSIGLTTVGN